jgi:hypothetical protein
MVTRCIKCAAPAGTILSYDYVSREVWLEDGSEPAEPGYGFPLCETHADRLTPPVGWTLEDRRSPVRPLFVALEVA